MIVTASTTVLSVILLKVIIILCSGVTFSHNILAAIIVSQVVYYFAMSYNMMIFSLPSYRGSPASMFGLFFICDIVATAVELISRLNFAILKPPYGVILSIASVSLFRSAMIVILFYIAQSERLDATLLQEKAKYDQLLLLLTGFYTEAFFLRKSSADIESTMARCYELYRNLQKEQERIPGGVYLSQQALDVAKDIHEIKKDYQRIVAGMNRLIKLDTLGDHMPFGELMKIIISSNQAYSQQQKKQIRFIYQPEYHFFTNEFHSLISMLNNLLSNAVEAIDHDHGVIEITTQLTGWHIFISVKDNGSGIEDSDQQIIFAPGYTTKFSGNGMQSTGIGLTHVRSLATNLGGEVKVNSVPGETVFTLILPRDRIECLPEMPTMPLRAGGEETTFTE